MNKQAHIILIICDLFALWGMWFGYGEFQLLQSEIAAQVDTIRFGNRLGFAAVGLAFPILHLAALFGEYWIDYAKKYIVPINISVCVMIALLIVAGAAGSFWVETQVKNAGYVYCWRASGSSAISKTLVYTKDMRICEKLTEE